MKIMRGVLVTGHDVNTGEPLTGEYSYTNKNDDAVVLTFGRTVAFEGLKIHRPRLWWSPSLGWIEERHPRAERENPKLVTISDTLPAVIEQLPADAIEMTGKDTP